MAGRRRPSSVAVKSAESVRVHRRAVGSSGRADVEVDVVASPVVLVVAAGSWGSASAEHAAAPMHSVSGAERSSEPGHPDSLGCRGPAQHGPNGTDRAEGLPPEPAPAGTGQRRDAEHGPRPGRGRCSGGRKLS